MGNHLVVVFKQDKFLDPLFTFAAIK